MESHYIRILDNNEEWVKKLVPEVIDWRATVFEDITENGVKLTYIDISSPSGRPAIGLCGDTFFCEAGKDYQRKDTLILYRVESAELRLPTTPPKSFEGSLILLTQREFPKEELSDINYLFKETNDKQEVWAKKEAKTDQSKVKIVEKVEAYLKGSSESERKAWHPKSSQGDHADKNAGLELMRSIWRLFKLEKYTDSSPRQKGILDGAIKPNLNESEYGALLNLFNTSMINAFVQDTAQGKEDFFRLIGLMKDLPLTEYTRGAVWSSMASSLDPNDLRRDLKSFVQKINIRDSDQVNTWQTLILDVTKNVAKKNKDNLLRRMFSEAETVESPIQYIIKWTDRIQFDGSKKRVDSIVKEERKISEEDVSRQPKMPFEVDQSQTGIESFESSQSEKYKRAKVEEWVIQIRTLGLSNIENLKEGLSSKYQDFITSIKEVRTVKDVEGLVESFKLFKGYLKQNISLLPDPSSLKKDLKEAQDCFDSVFEILGEDVYRLMVVGVTPRDMTEIAGLIKHDAILSELPDWVWGDGDEVSGKTKEKTDRILHLENPITRNRIKRFLPELMDIRNQTPQFIKELPAQTADMPIDDYLSSLIDEGKKLGATLSEFDGIHHKWIRKALLGGMHEDQVQETANKLAFLKNHSNKDVFKGIMEKIESASDQVDVEKIILLYENALLFYKEHFGDSDNATLATLDSWIIKNEDNVFTSGIEGKSREIELTLQHNRVDHPSRRVPLVYFDYSNINGQYGFVTVPILFSTRKVPKDLHLFLEYEISSQLTNMWPTTWEKPVPESFSIAPSQWRKQKDTFIYSFKVRIPVRKPDSERTKIGLKLKASDENKQHVIKVQKTLHWEQVVIGEQGGIQLRWPDGVNTGYVDEHPIGPQEHVSYIEGRVFSGSSFAVVAPRRFGKTTLAQYLMERADSQKLVIPKPVLCTSMGEGGSTINYKKIWNWFNKSLLETLHSPIDFDEDQEVPGPNAFDHVRLAAKKAGKEAILLILDEAQLFFPKAKGQAIGTKLKDMLELYWSRRDMQDMVPVYFGLIGLPGMLERMGNNLQGFLMPKDIRTFKEVTLAKLIYKFTRNQLHTTREAREELSRKAGNLFILKTLLSELTGHINDDNRNWADYDDVKDVIERLKGRLVDLREPGLEAYLRDILNEAEDINFWKPRPCYPMAVALAKAYSENLSAVNAIERARDILNNWCLNSGFDGTKRLVYNDDQVDEHLQKLMELGVIDRRSGFQFDILEAWLLGISKQFPADNDDREALFRGALTRIRLPEVREKVHAGSQADVYRFSEEEVNYALRTVSLHKQRDRKRFHDTIEILKTLKKSTDVRSPGTEYIYNLREIGIADDEGGKYDGMVGVEIYQWVDGICLIEKVGRLNLLLVADIGIKLSKALRFIHGQGIFHRDICPRNIILEDSTTNPVLIDFGLAKYSTYPMNTAVKGDYTAPEILGKSPQWSSAADVFSLGKTLFSLISDSNQNDYGLIDLLQNCMNEEITYRPDADALVENFEKIFLELQVSEKQFGIWEKVQQKCREDMEEKWFFNVMEKFKPRFLAVSLGLHDDIFDKCAEVAQFLDFVLEAYPTSESLKLSYVFNKENDLTGNRLTGKECIHFMSNLRIERSHFDPKKNKIGILQRFKNPEESQMLEWAMESANLIAECLQLRSLTLVVKDLLGQ